MTHVIDGRAIAKVMNEQTAESAASLRAQGVIAALAVVVPTDDMSAAWYGRSIQRAAARTGIECRIHRLPRPSGRQQIAEKLGELSEDPAVHGIICQAPLPAGVALAAAGSSISVRKDIDGASPASLGLLVAGVPGRR